MKLPLKSLRQNSALLSAATLMCATAHAFVTGNPSETPAAAPATDRIIVKYKDNTPMATANSLPQAVLDEASLTAGAELQHVRRLSTGAQLLRLDMRTDNTELAEIIGRLQQDPDVEYVEPDLLMQPMTTADYEMYYLQWNHFEPTGGLNVPAAWDITQGEGAVVGVIDTGYTQNENTQNPDLLDKLLPGYDMISVPQVSRDDDGRDSDASDKGDWQEEASDCAAGTPVVNVDDPYYPWISGLPSPPPARGSSWHGNYMAGIVAATANNGWGLIGVAHKAKVVPVRALGHCGGYTSDIADAIIWGAGGAVADAPANANPAQVLALGIGASGSCGPTTQSAIDSARALGATVVVAAGNDNSGLGNTTPANCDGVVTVGATDRTGSRAWYSNYGSPVDVSAPGGDNSTDYNSAVLSIGNPGTRSPDRYWERFTHKQGTSAAAAHVAGVAALLYAKNPTLTPTQVEAILKDTARSFPVPCQQCGSGIVDAAAAVAAAGEGQLPFELANGVAVSGLRDFETQRELHFSLDVPVDVSDLQFQISGGTGDADLYVQFGSPPTTSSYDCRPNLAGNNETCSIPNAQTGTYYGMVRAESPFTDVNLVGSFDDGSTGWIKTDVSGSEFHWQHFTLEVNPHMSSLSARMFGGNFPGGEIGLGGYDNDIFLRHGSKPAFFTYDCRTNGFSYSERCTISNPAAGTWYISIYTEKNFTGVTLEAQATR